VDKRVRGLLQGIKDPKANAVKEMILENYHLCNDFTAAVTHLATSLQLQGSLSDNQARNVSGLQSGCGNNNRGRGCARGNVRGGGGRGRGRGRNIYLGSYSPEQWAALSNEDKQRVRDGHANSNAQQQQQQQGKGNNYQVNAKHNISGLTTEGGQQEDMVSAITMGTMTAAMSNNGNTNNSGRQPSTDTSTTGQSMSRRQRISAVKKSRWSANPDTIRVVSQMNVHQTGHSSRTETCELDSHADTLVAGANFVILEYTDTSCSVTPFCKSYESKQGIPIVKAATTYDDEATGVTYILILGQALYFGEEVESRLLCPNQLRANGVIVDDTPVHLLHNRSSTHSITFPEDNVTIPLKLNGCFSMIKTRTPSAQEIES